MHHPSINSSFHSLELRKGQQKTSGYMNVEVWRQGTRELRTQTSEEGTGMVIRFFSIIGHHKILNIVPCAIKYIRVVYLFCIQQERRGNDKLRLVVNRYRLLYTKQINNKGLLYSTENCIHYFVIVNNGKELEK